MKWAIREAIDVFFKAKAPMQLGARTIRPGEPVLIFDTVQTSALEVAAEISYVTGGRGNARILSFEGDKTLSFNFEDALLSNEGLAILAGAELIPARNIHLPGASRQAKSVITHFTETVSIEANDQADTDPQNQMPNDESLRRPGQVGEVDLSPRGGFLNVWLTNKPYVGQNASLYAALLNDAGEMAGAPVEVNLNNPSHQGPHGGRQINFPEISQRSHIAKFETGDAFIAVNRAGVPMRFRRSPGPNPGIDSPLYPHPCSRDACAVFDDQVEHYVDVLSMAKNWLQAWGPITDYIRIITAANFGAYWGEVPSNYGNPTAVVPPVDTIVRGHNWVPLGTATNVWVREIVQNPTQPGQIPMSPAFSLSWEEGNGQGAYSYLLAPSGGVAQPKAFRERGGYVYKANVPSILRQDTVFLDYYVEHRRHATQISILPDKFGSYMYVEGDSLVRRASDGMDLPVHFVIPKFKITTQLNFTMAATGDASTFNFEGDAYPDFSKFDMTRRVLADIQVIDASANFDVGDPTDYRRFQYVDGEEEYLWKDPSMQPHSNIDYADTITYLPDEGGPATITPGDGLISTAAIRRDEGIPPRPDNEGRLDTLTIVGFANDYENDPISTTPIIVNSAEEQAPGTLRFNPDQRVFELTVPAQVDRVRIETTISAPTESVQIGGVEASYATVALGGPNTLTSIRVLARRGVETGGVNGTYMFHIERARGVVTRAGIDDIEVFDRDASGAITDDNLLVFNPTPPVTDPPTPWATSVLILPAAHNFGNSTERPLLALVTLNNPANRVVNKSVRDDHGNYKTGTIVGPEHPWWDEEWEGDDKTRVLIELDFPPATYQKVNQLRAYGNNTNFTDHFIDVRVEGVPDLPPAAISQFELHDHGIVPLTEGQTDYNINVSADVTNDIASVTFVPPANFIRNINLEVDGENDTATTATIQISLPAAAIGSVATSLLSVRGPEVRNQTYTFTLTRTA